MKSGTPIYDIKPYIKYADCRPEAKAALQTCTKQTGLKLK